MGRCPTYVEHESGRWVRGDDREIPAKLRIEERELEAGLVYGGAGSAGDPPRGKNGEQHQQAADPARLPSPLGSCTLLRIERWID